MSALANSILPPPDLLKAYESVLPGAAARILQVAELEQKRMMAASETLSQDETYYRLGVIVSLVSYCVVIASILVYAVTA